jgi:hypothetical protein
LTGFSKSSKAHIFEQQLSRLIVKEARQEMKKSIIVLLVVLAIIGVAAIGIAASKKGQDGQGQNNNDQGCDRNHPCSDDNNECTRDFCNSNGECVHQPTPGVLCNSDAGSCDTKGNCVPLG